MFTAIQVDVLLISFVLQDGIRVSGRAQIGRVISSTGRETKLIRSPRYDAVKNRNLHTPCLEVRAEKTKWSTSLVSDSLSSCLVLTEVVLMSVLALVDQAVTGGYSWSTDRIRRAVSDNTSSEAVSRRWAEQDWALGSADLTPALLQFLNPQESTDLDQKLYWATQQTRGASWHSVFRDPSAGHPPLEPTLSLRALAKDHPVVEKQDEQKTRVNWSLASFSFLAQELNNRKAHFLWVWDHFQDEHLHALPR